MPYIENRIVHDADAHTMELPNWYQEFGTKRVQDAFKERFKSNKGLAHTYFDNIDNNFGGWRKISQFKLDICMFFHKKHKCKYYENDYLTNRCCPCCT